VNSSTVNGQRRIEVKTPNQLIEINDRDGRDIHVNVTQTASGEQATYDAQDIKDLKQQNAEIAQLYEKYTKPAVNNVQGFGEKPALAGPPPGLPRDINPSGGKKTKEAHQQIEKCLTRLAKVNTALKEMKKESFDESKLTALLEELDAAKKELFAAQAQLE
jgi:hypothetical protein